MSYVLAERVRERTFTTGTGPIELAGTISGNQRTFVEGIGDGNTTRYCLLSGNGIDWEVGDAAIVTAGSPDTLTRNVIFSYIGGTVGTSPISLVGESKVFCYLPPVVGRFINVGNWDGTAAFAQNNVVLYGGARYAASEPIPAAPSTAPVIDGHAKHNGTTSGSPVTVTLSTTNPDDTITVIIAINGGKTAVPTAAGLAFDEVGTELGGAPIRPTIGGFTVQQFHAHASLPLSSKIITITPSGSADFSVVAFGTTGTNLIYPYDTNRDHEPNSAAGNTVNLDTDGHNLFLIYADLSATLGFNETTVPTGFTLIEGCNYVPAQLSVSGRSVTTQQVGVSLVGSASNAIMSYVDVLTSENPPPNIDPRWVPLGQDLGATDQIANTVFAGPITGADAPPGFRALVSDDLPSPYTKSLDVVFNNVGQIPASQTSDAGISISSNYSGDGHVDLWNTCSAGGTSGFNFRTKLSPTTFHLLSQHYGDGTFVEFDFIADATVHEGFFIYADGVEAAIGSFGSLPFTFYVNGSVKRAAFNVSSSGIELFGSTSGSIILDVPAVAGTRTIKFPAGSIDFTATGGAGRALRQLSAGGAITVETTKYDIAFSAPQTTAYSASQVIGHHRFAVGATIPANFGAHLGRTSQAGGSAVTTGSTVFSVEKAVNATPNSFSQVGTITFAAGTVTPTFASSGGTAITFAAGDVLRIVAPSSPDATFAGFYATLVGFET